MEFEQREIKELSPVESTPRGDSFDFLDLDLKTRFSLKMNPDYFNSVHTPFVIHCI